MDKYKLPGAKIGNASELVTRELGSLFLFLERFFFFLWQRCCWERPSWYKYYEKTLKLFTYAWYKFTVLCEVVALKKINVERKQLILLKEWYKIYVYLNKKKIVILISVFEFNFKFYTFFVRNEKSNAYMTLSLNEVVICTKWKRFLH